MKNYPNQTSSFARIRLTLLVIDHLNDLGKDANSNDVLGYECARGGVYTYRYLDMETATPKEIADRIALEQEKSPSDQGALTFARELRRMLRDMGWVDHDAVVTPEGKALLSSSPDSVEEQALLIEGLLNIETTDRDGTNPHHPIPVMLKLLAEGPSLHREGLELALEPRNDSDAEFERVRNLYHLSRDEHIKQLGVSPFQRANAIKIFPTLAVTAGLVVVDGDGYFSLSQDGWRVIGESPTTAKKSISKRHGRRTTVGKLVTPGSIASRTPTGPPKTLTEEEQHRAAQKLRERTSDHQELVQRVAAEIGYDNGRLFEDEFSYDLLWIPDNADGPVILFEMKTITSSTDAYARMRHAVGQLSYYDYFYVSPTWPGRVVLRVAAVDADIPTALAAYLKHDDIGAILAPKGGPVTALNSIGKSVLGQLP